MQTNDVHMTEHCYFLINWPLLLPVGPNPKK